MKRKSSSVRFTIEPLEQRRMLDSVVVNTVVDETDAPGSGTISLRDAITTANTAATATTITFDPVIFATAETIVLASAIEISSPMPVTVTGPSSGLMLQGGGNMTNLFTVDSGATASISQLTLTNGNNLAAGGAVVNNGTLSFTDCTFSNNISGAVGTIGVPGSGGAISNTGTLSVVNCTFTGNVAENPYTLPGGGLGGALFNSGTVTAINDTFDGNTATTGGAIYNSGTLNIGNTIVAGDTATSGPDITGTVASLGYNLIGQTDSSNGWIATDLKGSSTSPENPLLGALASNGGPTQTMLPNTDSPAIRHGSVALIPAGITTDQIGAPRVVLGTVDDGAVEVQGAVAGTAGTTTTLQSSGVSFITGQTITLTAKVAATTSGVPTGSVLFSDNGIAMGDAVVGSGGKATYSVTTLPAGSDSITASYSGDANFAPSTSQAVVITSSDDSGGTGGNGGTGGTGGNGGGGNGGGGTVSNNSGPTITKSTVPASIVQGSAAHAVVVVSLPDPNSSILRGTYTLQIIASSTSTAQQIVVGKIKRSVRIAVGKSQLFSIAVALPKSLAPDTYDLLVQATDQADNITTNDSGLTFDIAPAFVTLTEKITRITLPASGVAGVTARGSVVVSISNGGNVPSRGKTSIVLSAVDSVTGLSAGSAMLTLVRNLVIRPGGSVSLVLPIRSYPVVPAGSYNLMVTVTDPFSSQLTSTTSTDLPAINIAAAVVQLTASFGTVTSAAFKRGAVITIINNGNVADVSQFTAVVGLSSDATGTTTTGTTAGTVSPRLVRIKAGRSARVTVTGWAALLSTLPAGDYYLTVTLTDSTGNTATAVSAAAIG